MRSRASPFSSDPVLHHPLRLAIVIHLVREGGEDHFSSIRKMAEPASLQSAWLHCDRLREAGYITRELRYVGPRKPRTWLTLTDAGYAALARYRDDILNMITGPIARPAMQMVETNSLEANTS